MCVFGKCENMWICAHIHWMRGRWRFGWPRPIHLLNGVCRCPVVREANKAVLLVVLPTELFTLTGHVYVLATSIKDLLVTSSVLAPSSFKDILKSFLLLRVKRFPVKRLFLKKSSFLVGPLWKRNCYWLAAAVEDKGELTEPMCFTFPK